MTAVLAIALAVAVTYAVNTWKIRLVAKGKALAAASMEATQGFSVPLCAHGDPAEYRHRTRHRCLWAGAFIGTITAMLVARNQTGPLVPHHHDCCPPPGTPGPSAAPQQTELAHAVHDVAATSLHVTTTEGTGTTRRKRS